MASYILSKPRCNVDSGQQILTGTVGRKEYIRRHVGKSSWQLLAIQLSESPSIRVEPPAMCP
jgi:hypothetical protein